MPGRQVGRRRCRRCSNPPANLATSRSTRSAPNNPLVLQPYSLVVLYSCREVSLCVGGAAIALGNNRARPRRDVPQLFLASSWSVFRQHERSVWESHQLCSFENKQMNFVPPARARSRCVRDSLGLRRLLVPCPGDRCSLHRCIEDFGTGRHKGGFGRLVPPRSLMEGDSPASVATLMSRRPRGAPSTSELKRSTPCESRRPAN